MSLFQEPVFFTLEDRIFFLNRISVLQNKINTQLQIINQLIQKVSSSNINLTKKQGYLISFERQVDALKRFIKQLNSIQVYAHNNKELIGLRTNIDNLELRINEQLKVIEKVNKIIKINLKN